MLTTPLNELRRPLFPPTQDNLPYEEAIPMETERHQLQMELLINSLKPWLKAHRGGYVGGNRLVYFSLEQLRHPDGRGPDVFVVLGVSPQERKSWVVWEEGKGPDVVIELLSEKTAENDKSQKKDIYQNQLKVAEYFWFDPFRPEDWAGFGLRYGIYEPLLPNQNYLSTVRVGINPLVWHL